MRLANKIRLALGLPFKPEDYGGGLTLLDPGPRTAAEREAWERRKAAMDAETIRNWDHQGGTCLACDLPLRLHPSVRLWASKPSYCDEARDRDAEDTIRRIFDEGEKHRTQPPGAS